MSLRLRTLPAGFIEPCLPTSSKRPPSGDGWLHEIKHDGFRCHRPQGRQAGAALQPAGNDLTRRFTRIVEARGAAQGADLHHRWGGGRVRSGWHRHRST